MSNDKQRNAGILEKLTINGIELPPMTQTELTVDAAESIHRMMDALDEVEAPLVTVSTASTARCE